MNLLEKGSYVNLGNLFPGSRAAEQSPVFSQSEPLPGEFEESERLHVALVKIDGIAILSNTILQGIAETLAQLNRLSISPCVVVEAPQTGSRAEISEEVDKLVTAVGEVGHAAARRVDNIFSTNSSGQVQVSQRTLLMRPLRRGQIPVVTTVAYNQDNQKMDVVPASDAMLAITKELAGSNNEPLNPGITQDISLVGQMQKEVSLDRLITIDSAGGIPNETAADGRHVFLNLEQEYDIVKKRLEAKSQDAVSKARLSNLILLQKALRFLPQTSSGLMTTYEEAANVKTTSEDSDASSVGTRRKKSTLIHNLLTDKPAYSSSLPIGRLTREESPGGARPIVYRSSFVKRGMPLAILPDPFRNAWTATSPRLKLTDSRIDLEKLVYLIEDSFGRKLDVEDYLDRVNDRIAGVIVAGDYEGGAILTWETPPDNPQAELVPYLDKFAVLRRSQGAGGVADIVFNAMVRSCFPDGVCWRSRGGNPVNKWYMERSRGTWKLSKAWTMFWTTPDIETDTRRFQDYASVCRGVQPSWADKQKPAD